MINLSNIAHCLKPAIVCQIVHLYYLKSLLTDAIFETGASGVPSKSQKSFICVGVGQTITLKSLGKGAPPSTPSRGLQ